MSIFDEQLPKEFSTEYVIVYDYNGKELKQIAKNQTDAELIRWKLIHEVGYKHSDVTIHLRQKDRFGDVVTINENPLTL